MCVQTGIRACVAGGKVVIVGLGSEEAKIPISIAACKEIDILGSFRYCNTVSPCSYDGVLKCSSPPCLAPHLQQSVLPACTRGIRKGGWLQCYETWCTQTC